MQENEDWDTEDSGESIETAENLPDINIQTVNGELINVMAEPVKAIPCKISTKLFFQIQEIENLVLKKFGAVQEFSIYLHADFTDDGELIVSDTYYIPKQKVSAAYVDYKESPHAFYNGCLHRHPNGCTSFSGTDDKYINSNFEFSLLYVNGYISTGIVNIKYAKNRKCQMRLQPMVCNMDEESDIDITNIEQNVYQAPAIPSVAQPNPIGFTSPHLAPNLPGFNVDDDDESLVDDGPVVCAPDEMDDDDDEDEPNPGSEEYSYFKHMGWL